MSPVLVTYPIWREIFREKPSCEQSLEKIQQFDKAHTAWFISRRNMLLAFAAVLLLVVGCGGSSSGMMNPPPPPPPPTAQFELAQIASGFSRPLDIQQPGDNSRTLFVVEQGGRIQIIQGVGTRASTPFLDVTGRAGFTAGGETGLLGLVFHPQYAQNHRFFVNYTRTIGGQLQSVIAEFTASTTNANFTDPGTENILFTLDQPFANHNGGGLAFGQDGYLYIAFGDGGSGGDPQCNGQNINVLLGKILRIDVNSPPAAGLNYAIPPNNPFVNQSGRDEIW
jgi:glucose/arabinose dehydrogenase